MYQGYEGSPPKPMKSYRWPVVPLSKGQLLDVDPKDLLNGGTFRQCDTYKGGGGYDHFPDLAECYFGESNHHLQFVVQLFGCNLDCPYCYVTREGVWGGQVKLTSQELVEAFNASDCTVFHLMGGAPALRIAHWQELLLSLQEWGKKGWVFHSDLMLSEKRYNMGIIDSIASKRALYAVNIKGVTHHSYFGRTRKKFHEELFWFNLKQVQTNKYFNHYYTFTGMELWEVTEFWRQFKELYGAEETSMEKSKAFTIDLIDYEATAHVDDVNWGLQRVKN